MLNKKKILIYSEAHILGGAERYIATLVSILSEKWDIVFVYRSDIDLSPVIDKIKKYDIEIIPQPYHGSSFESFFKLKDLFKKINPDLIVFNLGHFYSAKAARLASIQLKIPYVLIQHGPASDGVKHFNFQNKMFARLTFPKALETIVPSNNSADFLMQYFPYLKKPTVIANGIDLEIFNPIKYNQKILRNKFVLPEEAFVLSFIGSMEANKKPEWAINIFNKLSVKYSNLHLILLGEGKLKETLIDIAKAFPSREKIHFLDSQPNSVEVLKVSDLLIMTSEHESCPFVVIEAMAMGVPIVAFKIDEIPLMINAAGKTSEFGHLDEMEKNISDLILNEDIRIKLGEAGIKKAKEYYDQELMSKKTLRVFEEIFANLDKIR